MAKQDSVEVLSTIITTWIDIFFTSWTLMLMAGTLLGNVGLWTPAYWEVLGSLFVLSNLTGFVSRRYYITLRDMTKADLKKLEKTAKAKPII